MESSPLPPHYQPCELETGTDYSLNFGSDPQLPSACMERCGSAFTDSLEGPQIGYVAADEEPDSCRAKVTFGNIAVRRTVGLSRHIIAVVDCTEHGRSAGEAKYRARCQNSTEQLQVITDAS